MIGEIPISDACHYMDAHDTETCALVEEKFQDILFWKSLSVFICEKSMI